MNFFIHQNIVIHTLKINGLSNSSVFQVGTAGVIKPLANLYNTGGFTQSAPSLTDGTHFETPTVPTQRPVPFAPLVSPVVTD